MLDRHLAAHPYMAGEAYSIADIAIWPWYGGLVRNALYDAAEFLDAASYANSRIDLGIGEQGDQSGSDEAARIRRKP